MFRNSSLSLASSIEKYPLFLHRRKYERVNNIYFEHVKFQIKNLLKNFSSSTVYFNRIQNCNFITKFEIFFENSCFQKIKKKNLRKRKCQRPIFFQRKKKSQKYSTRSMEDDKELIVHETRKSWTFSITSCCTCLREGIPSIRRVSSRLGDTPVRFRPVFAGLDPCVPLLPWRSKGIKILFLLTSIFLIEFWESFDQFVFI